MTLKLRAEMLARLKAEEPAALERLEKVRVELEFVRAILADPELVEIMMMAPFEMDLAVAHPDQEVDRPTEKD